MEEKKKENISQKNFEIKINNENFILNLGLNKDENKLCILARTNNIFEFNYYKLEATYDELTKLNKYFIGFESLEEIKEELNKIFSEPKNLTINFENEQKIIKIIFDFTFGTNIKKIELLLEKMELSYTKSK